MLSKLLYQQLQLMVVLGVKMDEGGDDKLPLPGLLEAAIGMTVESAEVLDELNRATRPWKPQEASKEHITEEAIDTLFYLLEVFTLLKVDDKTIVRLYNEKYFYNLTRVLASVNWKEREDAIINMKKLVQPCSKIEVAVKLLMANGYISMGSDFTDSDLEFVVDPLHAIR